MDVVREIERVGSITGQLVGTKVLIADCGEVDTTPPEPKKVSARERRRLIGCGGVARDASLERRRFFRVCPGVSRRARDREWVAPQPLDSAAGTPTTHRRVPPRPAADHVP